MSQPRYPLLVVLPRGQVRHAAKLIGDGPRAITLCRKVAVPTGDGAGLPYCAACTKRPNPINQQSTNPRT